MLPEAVNPLGARIARYYSALWAALLATGCLLLGRGECSGIHRGGGALALPGVFPKKTLDLLDTTAVVNRKGKAVGNATAVGNARERQCALATTERQYLTGISLGRWLECCLRPRTVT